MASLILTDKWYSERNSNLEDNCIRVVTAAAKLIKAQIRESQYSCEHYPLTEEFSDVRRAKEWVPKLLNCFMENLMHDSVKQASISHGIVQGARPRSVVAPILLGVGVSLDHAFGSEWLLNTLASLGLSVSYDEVTRYKQSVVQSDTDVLPESYPGSFTQWAGDNVDHNINSLDGRAGFHGMGVISMSVMTDRHVQGEYTELSLTRLKRQTVDKVTVNRCIAVVPYIAPNTASLSLLQRKPFAQSEIFGLCQPSLNLDLLWHVSWFYSDFQHPRANWSGFMHDMTSANRDFPHTADIRLLPIIDLNPNDMSCVFSTLAFVSQQSQLLGMPTACITFDQPLWQKAVEVVRSTGLDIVCRLGSFHTVMNFLGAVGSIMSGPELAEALQVCYGPVSVTHMLTGKTFAKAVRGHLLVESALNVILMRKFVTQDPQDDEVDVDRLSEPDLKTLQQACDRGISSNTVCNDEELPH